MFDKLMHKIGIDTSKMTQKDRVNILLISATAVSVIYLIGHSQGVNDAFNTMADIHSTDLEHRVARLETLQELDI